MARLAELEDAVTNARAAGDAKAVDVLTRAIDKELEALYGSVSSKEDSDAGFFENVRTGFASGAVGMAETAALGAAAFYEEEEELKARDKIKSVAESFRPEGGDKDSLTSVSYTHLTLPTIYSV